MGMIHPRDFFVMVADGSYEKSVQENNGLYQTIISKDYCYIICPNLLQKLIEINETYEINFDYNYMRLLKLMINTFRKEYECDVVKTFITKYYPDILNIILVIASSEFDYRFFKFLDSFMDINYDLLLNKIITSYTINGYLLYKVVKKNIYTNVPIINDGNNGNIIMKKLDRIAHLGILFDIGLDVSKLDLTKSPHFLCNNVLSGIPENYMHYFSNIKIDVDSFVHILQHLHVSILDKFLSIYDQSNIDYNSDTGVYNYHRHRINILKKYGVSDLSIFYD